MEKAEDQIRKYPIDRAPENTVHSEIERGKARGSEGLAPDPGQVERGGQVDLGQKILSRGDTVDKLENAARQENSVEGLRPVPKTTRETYEASLAAYLQAGDGLLEAKQKGSTLACERVRAMRRAAAEMDANRPGSEALLLGAMQNDRAMAEAVRDLRVDERVYQVLYGMAMEDRRQKGLETPSQPSSPGAAAEDPAVRARRVLDRWKELDQAQGKAELFGDRARISRDMRQLVQDVREDPQVERVLSDRARAQGMDLKGKTMAAVMERQIRQKERDRDRDRGMEQ